MKRPRSLPYGICRTFFFNACDRKARLRSKRRPCYTAYVGHGPFFRSKRFPIDSLGETKAYSLACKWRVVHGGFLTVRTCDVVNYRRRFLSRRPRGFPTENIQRYADLIIRHALKPINLKPRSKGASTWVGPTFFDTALP